MSQSLKKFWRCIFKKSYKYIPQKCSTKKIDGASSKKVLFSWNEWIIVKINSKFLKVENIERYNLKKLARVFRQARKIFNFVKKKQ